MGEVVDVTPTPRPAAAGGSLERRRGGRRRRSRPGSTPSPPAIPSFDPRHFLAGARAAYEMIINAFAAGDVEALRGLLAPEPLANFSRAIAERNAAGQKMASTLVSLDKADIVEAGVRDATALISVKFASKMNSATTDRSGRRRSTVRRPGSSTTSMSGRLRARSAARNPNWLLSATEATH